MAGESFSGTLRHVIEIHGLERFVEADTGAARPGVDRSGGGDGGGGGGGGRNPASKGNTADEKLKLEHEAYERMTGKYMPFDEFREFKAEQDAYRNAAGLARREQIRKEQPDPNGVPTLGRGSEGTQLARGFQIAGVAGAAASGLPGMFDPGNTSAQVGAGLVSGGIGAAVMGAGAMTGLTGFMVSAALAPVAQGIFEATVAPDVRQAKSAASGLAQRFMDDRIAGIESTPERASRQAFLENRRAEITEEVSQRANNEALADRVRRGKSSFLDDVYENMAHPWDNFIGGAVRHFRGQEAANLWLAERIIDRTRPAARDNAFDSASSM